LYRVRLKSHRSQTPLDRRRLLLDDGDMHPLIENNREAIAQLCRIHGIRRLEVFGSILRDDFDAERSDVDVLVEFDPPVAASFTNFLDLKEALEALFQRSVGLIELRAVRNRRLRHYIEQSKLPVYHAA